MQDFAEPKIKLPVTENFTESESREIDRRAGLSLVLRLVVQYLADPSGEQLRRKGLWEESGGVGVDKPGKHHGAVGVPGDE